MWLDLAVCFATALLLFWAGWSLLQRSDYGASGLLRRPEHVLFAAVFGFSSHQVFLLVCQVLNFLGPGCVAFFHEGCIRWMRECSYCIC